MIRRVAIAMSFLLSVAVVQAGAQNERVTFSKDIAPIVYENCVDCHRPGEIAPFSLLDFESARPWAKSIRKVVSEKTMPPWHADSSKVHYLNDRSISQEEIDTIVAWVNQGAKEGNPADLPEPPAANDTWSMGEPDFVFHALRDFDVPPGETEIEYQSIHLGPTVEEDLYITQWEIRPTVRKTVHHANLVRAPMKLPSVGIGQAVMRGGDYIGSYLPGARPMKYPEGTALRLPAGSEVQIQVHYIGLDEPVADHVMFGVKFAQGRIDKVVRTIGTDDYEMVIEPNGTFEMDTEVTLNFPLTLFSSGAHMHLRGSSYRATALFPDGTETLITDVPHYDFNWQSNYELANPVSVPKGTKFRVHATWDNTSANVNNPDPSQRVVYGKWTENEMLTTWSHVLLTDEKLGLKVKDGLVVGKFDDAKDSVQPPILQTLPNTFQMPRNTSTDD